MVRTWNSDTDGKYETIPARKEGRRDGKMNEMTKYREETRKSTKKMKEERTKGIKEGRRK